MIGTIITHAIVGIVCIGVGMLIGRKNPKVADSVAAAASAAQAGVNSEIKKV
jgi:hypothetical protein